MSTSTDDFPLTRSSLLSRVRHPSDAESWRVFHAQYERLVFQVCLKAGLKKEDVALNGSGGFAPRLLTAG